jgi:hypothetical protein
MLAVATAMPVLFASSKSKISYPNIYNLFLTRSLVGDLEKSGKGSAVFLNQKIKNKKTNF